MIEISDGTPQRIHTLFPESEWGQVEQVLCERCGDTLPLLDTSRVGLVDCIRYAVLKLSCGRMPELEHQVAEWNHQLILDEGHRNRMTVALFRGRIRGWLQTEYKAVLSFRQEEPVAG